MTLVRRDAGLGEYSPDGSRIAFIDMSAGSEGDLWVVPTSGGRGQKLVAGSVGIPRWSPDGSRIAYASDGVSVVDAETGEVTSTFETDHQPEWVDDDTLSLTP
jgi:dipeptidyl aminopeptidase/acylaminoacyl peptidase